MSSPKQPPKGEGGKPRLLVTGAAGLLGWNVLRAAADAGWPVIGVYRSALPPNLPADAEWIQADLTEVDAAQLLAETKASVVIHCAAAANAQDVERDPESASIINTTAPRRLAAAANARSVHLLHISTDLVFDGTTPPYREDDPTCPLSVYGRQKAEAETHVLELGGAVCRLPLLLGSGHDGLRGALRWLVDSLLGSGAKLFTDEYRSPLSASAAACGLLRLAQESSSAIWHLGGERTSRWQIGEIVARVWEIAHPNMTPVRQADLDLVAPRPADVSLDCHRAKNLGIRFEPLEQQLQEVRNCTRST